MSAAHLRFHDDSRFATLLSQEYRSTEGSLKELVDNAWDANDVGSMHVIHPGSVGRPDALRSSMTAHPCRSWHGGLVALSCRPRRLAGSVHRQLAGPVPRPCATVVQEG
ncbi:MAG: hypothetical protein E6Q80_10885 [Thauera aminoaromatica]|uniref:Uncharacterized protein n=1 Tax=Thauera aminoaromatica TaxID=164330 RepID=A0A5C7SM53_THASP|nr:MAG: hypothetical protein E6Q80_10885 [Thauera aminoaromatica]